MDTIKLFMPYDNEAHYGERLIAPKDVYAANGYQYMVEDEYDLGMRDGSWIWRLTRRVRHKFNTHDKKSELKRCKLCQECGTQWLEHPEETVLFEIKWSTP